MERSNKITAAILGITFLCGISSAAASGQQWFLMARHGECMEIESLKRKVPDLAGINDPYSFVKLMRQQGILVTVTEMSEPLGKAVEVKIPEKDLFLIFVTPELCHKSGEK